MVSFEICRYVTDYDVLSVLRLGFVNSVSLHLNKTIGPLMRWTIIDALYQSYPCLWFNRAIISKTAFFLSILCFCCVKMLGANSLLHS